MKTSNAKKIEKAKSLKELGNDFFKDQEFSKAARQYLEAILFVKGMVDSSNEYLNIAPKDTKVLDKDEAEQAALIHISCLSNLSVCHFKRQKYEKSLDKCEDGLKLLLKKKAFLAVTDFTKYSGKFYHRKILCLVELSYYERATKTLNDALKVYPTNPLVRSSHKILKEKRTKWLSEQKQKQRELFGNKIFT